MLKKLVQRFMAPRHFWREDAAIHTTATKKRLKIFGGFDELSELYASQLLRSFALGLINIFVPIFLYKLGYDIQTIFWFYVLWFAFRPCLDILSGVIIGRIGPKHTLMLGVFVQIFHLILLLTLAQHSWPLWLVAISGGWAYGLFILAFEVDFSKVKHKKHGGKEVGYASIFERAGSVAGPLMGGFIASVFSPSYTIVLAILVLIGSLVPLLMSSEPVKTKQHLDFENFPWKAHKRDFLSVAMLMLENTVVIILWPLFISVVVFMDNTYAHVGLVTALGTLGAIFLAYFIGKATDQKKGRLILRVSAVFNAVVHLARPFAQSFQYVLGINILNEPLAIGYRIPYLKAMFDEADQLPGFRIVYLSAMSAVNTAARFVFWLALWVAADFADPILVIKWGFVAGAIFSLGIMLERFASLDNNQQHG